MKLCRKNHLSLSVRKLICQTHNSFGPLYLTVVNGYPEEVRRLASIPANHWALLRFDWEEKLMVAWRTILELQLLNVLATNSIQCREHQDQDFSVSQEKVQSCLDRILQQMDINPDTAMLAHLRALRPEWSYWAPEKIEAVLPQIIREHLVADRPGGGVGISDFPSLSVPTSLAGTITTSSSPSYVASP
jgi:hypothetical protein